MPDGIIELDNNLNPPSIEELKKKAREGVNYKTQSKLAKYIKRHTIKISNLEADMPYFPKKGDQFRCITFNAFNAFTIVLKALQDFEVIDELYMSTYNMNEPSILSVFDFIDDEKIKKCSVITSESITFRMPKRIEQLRLGLEKRRESGRFRLALAWNHSKITLMRIGKRYIVIEGSGNLSENAYIEQYLIESSLKTYQFHQSWMEDTFAGKSVHKRQKVL